MKFNAKAITSSAKSGKFWSAVGYTAAGAFSGEMLGSAIPRFVNVSPLVSDIISGAVVGGITLGLGMPEMAYGTVGTKAVKAVSRIVG